MTYLQAQNLSVSYATKFRSASGNYRLRIGLNARDEHTRIVARNTFVTLIAFIETLLYLCRKKEKVWAKIYLQNGKKTTSLLVNIKSLCNRTLLTRNEILSKSPEELSHLLADPKNSWQYKKLNDFFPNVILINLDRSTDRIASLKEHLSIIGEKDFRYNRFSAVDAKTLAPKNPGEPYRDTCRYACYLSHLHAIKEAKARNLPYVLVLEDDVRFAPQDMQGPYMQKMMKELPKNWGILFLGCTEEAPHLAKKYSEHLKQPGKPFAMHAYVVNASMYDLLINTLEVGLQKPGPIDPVDVVMAEQIAQKLRDQNIVFASKTNIAFQDEGFSNICNFHYAPFQKESDAYYKRYDINNPNRAMTADGLSIIQPKAAGALYQMAHHVTEVLNHHNIRHWIDGSTTLGMARHGGLIPNEEVINLCILPEDIAKLNSPTIRIELDRIGLKVIDHSRGVHVYTKAYHHTDGQNLSCPCIELLFTKETIINGEKAYELNTLNPERSYSYKHTSLFNERNELHKQAFGPIQLNCVRNLLQYCQDYFGSNCMSETYLNYDLLRQSKQAQQPIQLTDYRLGPYSE